MMTKTLTHLNFHFSGQKSCYKGKVRDVYFLENEMLIMVASDRISAFDHILPKGIPYKGQVLNQLASYFLNNTRDIAPNWLIASPDPNVSVGYACESIRVEMVIRAYLSGHAAREYRQGKRILCGVKMPDGLRENDPFPQPIITPAGKAMEGHDIDMSKEEILASGLVSPEVYAKMEAYTYQLFQRGREMAEQRGLLLVDTKYEFGLFNGDVFLIDEIHTPDSSRYFYANGYEDRQEKGLPQKQLSKEFVRQWLIDHNFQGLQGQQIPQMPDSFVDTVSERYIELYEKITATTFQKSDTSAIEERIYHNVNQLLKTL